MEANRGPSVRISVITTAGITARKIQLAWKFQGIYTFTSLNCPSSILVCVEGRIEWFEFCIYLWTNDLWACTMLGAQLCPILCDPIDCSPSVSSVHGISQARVLDQNAISYSRSSQPRDQSSISCVFAIGGRIIYPWGTWEALPAVITHIYLVKFISVYIMFSVFCCQCSEPIRGFFGTRCK